MSGHWKEVGPTSGLAAFIPGPDTYAVENTDTGEVSEVYVGRDQTPGEAIANGQFTDRDLSHMNTK